MLSPKAGAQMPPKAKKSRMEVKLNDLGDEEKESDDTEWKGWIEKDACEVQSEQVRRNVISTHCLVVVIHLRTNSTSRSSSRSGTRLLTGCDAASVVVIEGGSLLLLLLLLLLAFALLSLAFLSKNSPSLTILLRAFSELAVCSSHQLVRSGGVGNSSPPDLKVLGLLSCCLRLLLKLFHELLRG